MKRVNLNAESSFYSVTLWQQSMSVAYFWASADDTEYCSSFVQNQGASIGGLLETKHNIRNINLLYTATKKQCLLYVPYDITMHKFYSFRLI